MEFLTIILFFVLFESLGGFILWFIITKKGINKPLSPGWAYLGLFGIAMVLLPFIGFF
jgi:hypothetical protein